MANTTWQNIRPVDGTGYEIRPGNIVTYPGRRGASIYMIDAVVVSAEDWSVPLLLRPIRERHVVGPKGFFKPRDSRKTVKVFAHYGVTLLPHLKSVKMSEQYEIVER